MEERVRKAIFNLQKNNMAGFYVENMQKLLPLLSTLLVEGEKIGCGDSVTLEETGVFEYLRNANFIFNNKHQPNLTSEEKRAIYLQL